MPVSGLVVTLSPPGKTPDAHPYKHTDDAYAELIARIASDARFLVGERQDQRLPVVLDTPDKQTDKDCWQWLNALPGVHHVDVAFIHCEDADAFDAPPCHDHTERLIPAPTIGET